jgi:hypothetical protein
MWGDCTCGHGPHRATHRWDNRTNTYTFCLKCVDCDRDERGHGPYGHPFKRCPCGKFQEAAA